MGAASKPGNSDPAPRHASEIAAAQQETPSGFGALDEVLAQTAKSTVAPVAGDAKALAALRGVAESLRDQPFALEPVVVELIYVALRLQFQEPPTAPAALRAVAETIAATLYEDPTSRQHLEALWLRLSQR